MSEKEDCFKEALDKYKELSKDDLKIDHQQPWVRDRITGWHKLEDASLWTRLSFQIRALQGKTLQEIAERWAADKDNPVQLRRPDFTVTTQEGRTLVIDNKFLRADCSMDDWSNTPGQSGTTQREDYNEINGSRNRDKNVEDLRLDRDVCNCPRQPERLRIELKEGEAKSIMEDRISGARVIRPVPGGQQLPGWRPGGVRVPGVRVPIPIFK
jgi:hypothetical protein